MEALYDVLQIDSKADQKEIKKAYVKMIRKYPPEKSPEEFKKIREAYERLSDPVSRAEYDAMSNYKDVIDMHYETGSNAYDAEDYKTAIKEFKKILIIEPKLTFAKNMLGLSLASDGQLSAALKQFKELIQINPQNANFHSNLAYVYEEMGEYKNAIKSYVEANHIDPIDDNIAIGLARLYIKDSQADKALEFLEECILRDNSDDFQDFIYYFEMVRTYLINRDEEGLEDTFARIENIIPDDDDEAREYVGWKFGKFAYELYEAQLYSLAEEIAEKALEIDDSNDVLWKLYETTHELTNSYDLVQSLINDEKILNPLKFPLVYYFYPESFDDNPDKEEIFENNLKAIQQCINYDYENVLSSMNKLRTIYKDIYKIKEELYSELYDAALKKRKLFNEFYLMKDDSSINGSIKSLVALWLSTEYTEDERQEYLNDITRRMKNESIHSAYNSLVNLNSKYPNLYNINRELLDELKEAYKNSINNYNRRTTTTSSNSSGCLLALIFTGIKVLSIPTIWYIISNI